MSVGSLGRQVGLGAILAVIGASVLFGVTLYVSPTQNTGSSTTIGPNCPSICMIIIRNDVYGNGQTIVVTVGTKVTWINNDSTQHTVTAASGAFASPIINPGGNFSYTFVQPGTYVYHDLIHPGMGVVIVGPPYVYSSNSIQQSENYTFSHTTVALYQAPNILIEGISLCAANCGYPSPHLSATIIVNSTVPLASLTLYVNSTLELTTGYSQTPAYQNSSITMIYNATANNATVPIESGHAYFIEFVAVFSNNVVSTATTTVTAS